MPGVSGRDATEGPLTSWADLHSLKCGKCGHLLLFGLHDRFGCAVCEEEKKGACRFACRYCGVGSDTTDIYVVVRNARMEGFCLGCYERHLDDKRAAERAAKGGGG